MSEEVVKWDPLRKQEVTRLQVRPLPNAMRRDEKGLVNALFDCLLGPRSSGIRGPIQAVELYRGCPVYGREYCSVFAPGVYGRFQYLGSKRLVSQAFKARYDGEKTTDTSVIPMADIVEETCPWCGIVGTPVFCTNCRSFSCKGMMDGPYLTCHCGFRSTVCERRMNYIGTNVR
jgi:hypothetical protein